MSWLRYFRRGYWDQERSRELQAYLDVETDENIARGMPAEEARYAARRKLGNSLQIREEIYHMNSIGFLETLWKDLRYGARLLRLNPGFAIVAILSLALGIGANTAIFQLLPGLGREAFLGPCFSAEEDRRGCGLPGAVISYPFWQREFGGSAAVLGKKITLEHHPVDVIGVTPQRFAGLEVGRSFDVALPLCSQPALADYSYLDDGTIWWLTVMGRLKPGWALNRASAHLSAISPGIFQATLPPNYPRTNVKEYLSYRLTAAPAGTGVSVLRNYYSDPLKMLLAIAGLVLLIACANLANLMLARASAREREIALRLALGASRGRLIGQLLAESLLIATLGAAFGTLLAGSLSQILVSLISTEGNRWFLDLALDWRVLGFTAGVAALTCVLFGLAPALRATVTSPGAMVKSGGRGITASRERFGLRRVLVVSQIALSLVLLVSALLFSRSLQHLMRLDAGFQQEGILIADTDITALRLPVERWDEFKQSVLDRIGAIPGVDAVADVKFVPLSGSVGDNHVWLDGSEEKINPYFNWISPGYFKTLATPFLAGRDFDAHDTRTSPKVAVVNEAFARRLGIRANAISKRFRREATPSEPEMVFEIVGLVKNAKYRDLRENFTPTIFLPMTQQGSPEPGQHILIRSPAPPAGLVASVKRTLAEVNPDIAYFFSFFKTRIREGLLRERLMAMLSGFFGVLAALLAATGLYGVISYMVARRTNEIGIRMALGADRRDVVKMILRESGLLLVCGVAAGAVLALAAAATARSMLFGLQPYDPVTFGMGIVLLAAVTLTASYLPARRAARLDPMMALRDE